MQTRIFTRALKEAFEEFDKPVYLVIEEVSRGNVAAIFGDIFQLLDRDEYFQSKYPIRNKDVANEIVELDNDMVYLPSNFNIIGTVNTNDQSVFPMDTAFKRRFDWEYVSVKPVK
ncbi:AAA family ATPase, partial [Staphylococcus haemolyticus]